MNEKKYTILFVDDEENNLIAFKNAFFRQYYIITALSGLQALDILRERSVQLIITDQRMPQMSGLDFLRSARDIQPEAVQVIITGYSDLSVIMEAFNELGIFHYALKPWNNQELNIIIENALTKYQLTRDNTHLIERLQAANEVLEEKVRERTSQLERKTNEYVKLNRLKDQIFTIISHDFRSPLTATSAFMELFLQSHEDLSKEDTLELMTHLQSQVLNLQEMLENLLSWSRSQMNEGAINYTPLPVNDLIEKNIRLYEPIAAQKGIRLTANLPAREIVVEADENRLHIVLRNLLSNALKFTAKGGKIHITSVASGSFASIAVTDTGVGMSADTVGKLFSNEHIVSTYGTAQEKGTGLGLKLCKELIEQQGGTLTIGSQPGQGSVFTFTLPLASHPN